MQIARQNTTMMEAFSILAVSIFPTLLGFAFFAFALNDFFKDSRIFALILPILAFIVNIFLIFKIVATQNENTGKYLFYLLSFFFGVIIFLPIASLYAATKSFVPILTSFGISIAILTGISLYVMVTKRDFTVLGTALFAVLVALIVSGIVLAFFPVPIAHLIWSIIGAIVFSLYIAYDVSIAVNKGIENPVHVALSLYLDVMNLFLSLLNISSFDLD